jgi:hypothetical protein
MNDVLFNGHLLLERRLDGAQNQILPASEIARKFGLECLPNAARRQLLPRADGSANEFHSCGLDENVT